VLDKIYKMKCSPPMMVTCDRVFVVAIMLAHFVRSQSGRLQTVQH
jgi:hypothetical protein